MIYLDTHVVVWLHAGAVERLSAAAVAAIEQTTDLRISPMVRLELQYLYEIGRVTQPPEPVLAGLAPRLGLRVCTTPFAAVVAAAETLGWTRDPFDRLIVAQAAVHGAALVTKDDVIARHYSAVVW